MSRWRAIPLFQRVLLVMLAAMPVFFAALYFILNGRLGVEYGGSLLLRSVQGETTLYAGRVDGKEAVFAVSPDGRVTYRFDGGDYGPYIVVEDPGAVPRDHDMADVLTGVEVRRGDEILFRGGWLDGGISVLIDESGAPVSTFSFSWHAGGKAYGPDGQEMDSSHEPSVSFLLTLVLSPVLRHRGTYPCIVWPPVWPPSASFPFCLPTGSSAGISDSSSGTRNWPSPPTGSCSAATWAGSSAPAAR